MRYFWFVALLTLVAACNKPVSSSQPPDFITDEQMEALEKAGLAKSPERPTVGYQRFVPIADYYDALARRHGALSVPTLALDTKTGQSCITKKEFTFNEIVEGKTQNDTLPFCLDLLRQYPDSEHDGQKHIKWEDLPDGPAPETGCSSVKQ